VYNHDIKISTNLENVVIHISFATMNMSHIESCDLVGEVHGCDGCIVAHDQNPLKIL
jgi:hypothetical protein